MIIFEPISLQLKVVLQFSPHALIYSELHQLLHGWVNLSVSLGPVTIYVISLILC